MLIHAAIPVLLEMTLTRKANVTSESPKRKLSKKIIRKSLLSVSGCSSKFHTPVVEHIYRFPQHTDNQRNPETRNEECNYPRCKVCTIFHSHDLQRFLYAFQFFSDQSNGGCHHQWHVSKYHKSDNCKRKNGFQTRRKSDRKLSSLTFLFVHVTCCKFTVELTSFPN